MLAEDAQRAWFPEMVNKLCDLGGLGYHSESWLDYATRLMRCCIGSGRKEDSTARGSMSKVWSIGPAANAT
jgi:hypothetical protein